MSDTLVGEVRNPGIEDHDGIQCLGEVVHLVYLLVEVDLSVIEALIGHGGEICIAVVQELLRKYLGSGLEIVHVRPLYLECSLYDPIYEFYIHYIYIYILLLF